MAVPPIPSGTVRGAGRLHDRHVREFFERGFTVVQGVFTMAEIGRVRAAFDRLQRIAERLTETTDVRGARFVVERVGTAGGRPRNRIKRVIWCGGCERELLDVGSDPRLLTMAAQLLGSPEMNQLINQAHFKLPRDGVCFPWHQDSTHRRYGTSEWRDVNGRGSYVQTALAVDSAVLENGPLWMIPGSCRFGHLGIPADGALPAPLRERDAVPVLMPAGSVALFGPYTVHGSRANDSFRARRTLINGYAFPGANSRIYPGSSAGRLLRAY